MTLWEFAPEIEAAVSAGATLAAGYALSRTASARLRNRGAPPTSVRGARVGITLASIAIAATIGFSLVGPITLVSGLTFSALIGLAATLALQTTLANIIAGFILLQNRMLRVNDTITVSGITGRVVQIGLVTVWLRLDDGNVASVSNANLLSGPVINRSAKDRLKGEY